MSAQSRELPADRPLGELEPVAHFDGPMLTGVTVSREGRIFVNFPKWGDDVEFTVAEVRDGKPVAYPSAEINQSESKDQSDKLISVQSVVVDPPIGSGSLTPEAPCSSRPSTAGRSWSALTLRLMKSSRRSSSPRTWPCQPPTSTTCASTSGAATRARRSSPTPPTRGRTGL